MRDKEGYNIDSYVIKNGHIYFTKDTYEIFQRTTSTPISNHLKYLMYDNYYLYFKWKEDAILEISYEELNNDSLSNYISFISVPIIILVSSNFLFFASIVGENNMFGHWCHWCMLSPTEWKSWGHEKGDTWIIQLINDNLEKQLLNENIVIYDKKDMFYQYYFIQFQ